MVLAVGFIALLEYRNSGLRTEDEVAACTGLPVIAVIPLMLPLDLDRSGGLKRLQLGGHGRGALPAGGPRQ